MVNRKELEKKLRDILTSGKIPKNGMNRILDSLARNHDMLAGASNEYLLGMKDLSEATIEELFWITDAISVYLNREFDDLDVSRKEMVDLKDYFSNTELVSYKKSKVLVIEEDIYPIVFENVIQVNEDQWVCVVDVNFLYELYKRQIINYNKNTQRPLTKKVVNGVETYKITLKNKSVKEIKNLLMKSLFISNDISLNINLDNPEVEFSYEQNSIVLHAGQLDIIDGYHRFRGMMLAKTEDENFNYNFIVNIMNFDENKACTFIAQEDKRNKINRQYSRSLDSTNLANTVVKRLNEDPSSYLCGSIGKNGDNAISSVYMFSLIDGSFSIKDMKDVLKTTKYLKEVFNILIEENTDLLEDVHSEKKLAIIIRGASKCPGDIENALHIIKSAFDREEELDERKFKRGLVNKSLFNEIDKIL